MKSLRSRLSAPRLWLSCHELVCRGEIVLQSHFSLDISARYFEIVPRSRLSRHERVWCGEIALQSRCGVDISTRYFEILPRWWLSRRDLTDLGAISARLPQSHRGLLFWARYFEISPRSWLSRRSRRDCRDLAEISVKFLQGWYGKKIEWYGTPCTRSFMRILKIQFFSFNVRNLWNLRNLRGHCDCHFSINQSSLKGNLNNNIVARTWWTTQNVKTKLFTTMHHRKLKSNNFRTKNYNFYLQWMHYLVTQTGSNILLHTVVKTFVIT